MTIQGNLGTIGQGEDNVLRSINRDRRTGRLSIFYENEQRRNVQDVIFIENGMIIGLKSLDKYGVKELLVYAGKLSKEQLADATARAHASGDPNKGPIEILLEEGTITRELVVHAVATLIRGCIQRVLTKPYGLYIFHPSDALKGVKAMTRISVLQIILDYCRAVKSPDVIASVIPSLDSIPRLTVNIEEIKKRYHLTEAEWKFLFQIGGEKSVRQIIDEGGFDETELKRHAYTALMCNFIRLSPPKTADEPTGAVGVYEPPTGPMGSTAPPPPPPTASRVGASPSSSGASMATPAPSLDSPDPRGTASRQRKAAEEPQEDRSNQPVIMVVDDSKTIQKMVEIALKDLPYRLVMADDGFAAIELAQTLDPQPELVILDVIMPRLDGYKTCGQLRRIFAPKKVPVIMLTARDGTFDKIKGKLAGASMYMAKPFEPADLQDAVNKFMTAAAR